MPSDEGQTGPGAPGERLRGAVERLTRLYEREAYRVYNVALRVAGDPGAAERVTEQAFLEQSRRADELLAADEGTTPPTLLPAAVRSALGAPRRRAPASDDPEATAMLEAAGKLRPPERAALALTTLTGAGANEVAAALGIAPDAAAQLLERARATFADKLHTPPGSLEGRLAAWPWADPPQDLWESVYRTSYRELDRWARGEQGAPPAAAAAPTRRRRAPRRPPRERAPRERRPRGEGRKPILWAQGRRRWLVRGAIVCVLLIGVAGVALTGTADDPDETASATTFADDPYGIPGLDGEDGDTSAEGSEDGEKPYEALTPEELDELRLQELDDLERYARQQADESLSDEQRAAAEARARELIAAAQSRQSGGSGQSDSKDGSGSDRTSGSRDGGSNGFARPPKQVDGGGGGGGGGGSSTTSGGATDGGSTDTSGGGGDGGGDGEIDVDTGGKNDGGGRGGGGGGKNDDGPSLDDCIRDTSTGQYVCPEREQRQAGPTADERWVDSASDGG